MKLDQNKIRKYRSRRILTTVLAITVRLLAFAITALIFVLVIVLLANSLAPSWFVELVTGLLYILYTLAYYFAPNDKN